MEPHTIEECWQKLCDLESLVFGFIENVNRDKEYTDADINGCRQSISNVTPYTLTKKVYIGDTEVIFENVPEGNLSVFMKDDEGKDVECVVERTGDTVVVSFVALDTLASVTISVV